MLALIEEARSLGLSSPDIYHAEEYFKYNEFELCFDQVITQLYEYDISINPAYYSLINEIGALLELPAEKYSFMKELIK